MDSLMYIFFQVGSNKLFLNRAISNSGIYPTNRGERRHWYKDRRLHGRPQQRRAAGYLRKQVGLQRPRMRTQDTLHEQRGNGTFTDHSAASTD